MCGISWSKSSKQQHETQGVQEDYPIDLADKFFAKLAGLETADQSSREALICEQE